MRRSFPPVLSSLAIIVSTILVARVVTHATGNTPSPVICGVQTHHWMYGMGLFYLGVARSSVPLACVGIGLVVDELDQVSAAMFPSYPPPMMLRA